MRYGCPNQNCKFHLKKDFIIRNGFYYRKNDSRKITRYRCKYCLKRFSNATFSLAKNQKKRRVNHQLFLLRASGMTMRRCAKILNIHRITVARKEIYLADKARLAHYNY